jgi:chromosomal replication initiation ATPase DnaA
METQNKKINLTIEEIVETICKLMDVDIYDVLYTKSRKRNIVECRYFGMYFIRKHIPNSYKNGMQVSYETIGKYYKKDHATVMHAVSLMEHLIKTNKEYRNRAQKYETILFQLSHNDICLFCNRPFDNPSKDVPADLISQQASGLDLICQKTL